MTQLWHRRLLGWLVLLVALVLLVGLYLLAQAVQHSDVLAQHYPLLLTFNISAILGLCGFIGYGIWQLRRQSRTGTPGARLTQRLLKIFVLLSLVPLIVLYYFSAQFLNRGIDSWFDVQIEQSLGNALLIERRTLEAARLDLVGQATADAALLAQEQVRTATVLPLDESSEPIIRSDDNIPATWVQLLDELREKGKYAEMTIYTFDGQIIASSGSLLDPLIPDAQPPDEQAIVAVREGRNHSSVEALGDDDMRLRMVVPMLTQGVNPSSHILQVVKPLPLRYSTLSNSIYAASEEYKKLLYLRGPLKFSFILTLTIIALTTILIASVLAFLFARRLASPLRELDTGARAVARGDYQTRLPVRSVDELGTLVQSFNEMTSQVDRAQGLAQQSRRQSELQRVHLETVLEHLSSGVLVLDRNLVIHTHNSAADTILHLSLAPLHDQPLQVVTGRTPRLEPLLAAVTHAVDHGKEWQEEVTLVGAEGRQVLLCRCTRLPPESILSRGYVVVFDEITDLIQAQRDAAWGEVARRLAHEIKNPLTPIRLSAERIQQKFLERLDEPDRSAIRRATGTIVQQVDSMKQMVDEFSGYAEPMHTQVEAMDLNQLIRDVMALHESPEHRIRIVLVLDPKLPWVCANPGRLRQVFNNLMRNARTALSDTADPTVTIETGDAHHGGAQYAQVTASDNGPGFPAELRGRLFEPYVTTHRKGGLGLAIVKRIVEEHDGIIRASNHPQGGALLRILLPIAETKPMASRASA